MAYHTALYLFIFLPIVLLAYQLTPQRYRWVTLLAAGYVFFWSFSGILVLFLVGTSLFTYGIGRLIEKSRQTCSEAAKELPRAEASALKKRYKKKQRHILQIGIAVLLGVLAYLKYYNFFAENVRSIAAALKLGEGLPAKELLLPIGISFYTMEAIGYLADIYWGKIKSDPNPGKLALFLGFFPQIMEGPIALYSDTADQLWEGKSLERDSLIHGALRILWGLFKKMVIADRLNVVVGTLYDGYESYHGIMIPLAAIFYTIQLYMEFSGSMDMILGSGFLFGIHLPENFAQPFLAKNAAEFWRRWHISLGVWFKSYIFYPMSVSGLVKSWNKFGRKHCSKYWTKVGITALTLFPVWMCNGLWHGPKWSYIFYGLYYFVILLLENMLEPVGAWIGKKLSVDREKGWYAVLRMVKTWGIIFTGELFFRADTVRIGMHMLRSMFQDFDFRVLADGTLLDLGIDAADYGAIAVGCLIVFAVEIMRERKLIDCRRIMSLRLPARWAVYYALMFAVLIFGAYGAGYQAVDLIYAGF